MDRRAIKFDWNRARAFLVTAEEGSLSAAARALGMAQPTLSRQVAALEAELGIPLFARVGRGLELTQAGLDLVEHVQAMGEAAGRLSLTAFGQAKAVEGVARISATEMAAAYVLPPILAQLREDHPGIRIELFASENPSDLRRREADIALRTFQPKEPDLYAKKLGEMAGAFYAAPAYLDRVGRPKNAADMARLDYIEFNDTGAYRAYLASIGIKTEPGRFPVMADRYLLHIDLAKAGLGLVPLPTLVGEAQTSLERVAFGGAGMTTALWLTAHSELKTSRRIRIVFDAIAKGVRDRLRADGAS